MVSVRGCVVACRAKQKGNRGEYELKQLLIDAGMPARRVPQSGSSPDMTGDLLVKHPEYDTYNACVSDKERKWEVKRRSSGFKLPYRWLKNCDVVAFRGDRKEWIVVMRLEDWLDK